MKIQICYARSPKAVCIEVDIPAGSTVSDAIYRSGIVEECAIHLEECKVGIHSQFVEMSHILQPEDRVEIYTPATAKERKRLFRE